MTQEMVMKIKIKYFEGATKLEQLEEGNWIDVYARKDIFVEHNTMSLVPLGFALELPKGWEGHLAPRSSTFKSWGVIQTNSVGVVDDTYIGNNDEWHMPIYCLTPKDEFDGSKGVWVRQGDKIGQFRIMKAMPRIILEEVDELENKNRGGFGTSGKTKVNK